MKVCPIAGQRYSCPVAQWASGVRPVDLHTRCIIFDKKNSGAHPPPETDKRLHSLRRSDHPRSAMGIWLRSFGSLIISVGPAYATRPLNESSQAKRRSGVSIGTNLQRARTLAGWSTLLPHTNAVSTLERLYRYRVICLQAIGRSSDS